MKSQGRPVIFGEVLFDRFPDGAVVLGGAPFNVAWHLQAFGLRPRFVSRVGDDEAGARVRQAMTEWGLDPEGLQTDPARPTGAVEVSLTDGSPSFSILAHQAYDEIAPTPLSGEVSLIYHGTLAVRTSTSRTALDALLRETQAPVFLDVNLRDPWWEAETVRGLLRNATWVKLNDDELAALGGGDDVEAGAAALQDRFALEALFVTRGRNGSQLWTPDGGMTECVPESDVPVVDTVGAGDAFTAVVLLGLQRGWPLPQIQRRAQKFASAMVGVRGGTCERRDFYEPFLDAWS